MSDGYIANVLAWMRRRGADELAIKCMENELRRIAVEQFGLKRNRWLKKQRGRR